MNLKLIWTNVNTVPVTTEIYRGNAPLDRANLGTPLVTLTNQETEWIDTTVEANKLYYYVFVTMTANDRNVSNNFPIRSESRRGPGSMNLIYGDYEIGYFGMLTTTEFIGSPELVNKLGLTNSSGAAITYYNLSPNWHKFVRKGKIYLVPDSCIANTGFTYKHLYDNGLVYGTNNNGPYTPTGSTPRNQLRTITVGPDTFIVRCMKGYGEDASALVPATAVTDPKTVCEWTDFMYPQAKVVWAEQRLPNCAPERSGGVGANTTNGFICQEMSSANNYISRGSNYSATNSNPQWLSYLGGRASTGDSGWYPILELVES